VLAPCPWLHAPLLVLDLGLDVVDGVRRLHLEGDRLAREGLDEDLHRDRRRGVVVVDVHGCEQDPGLVVVQTHVPQNGAYAETRVYDFLSPSTSTDGSCSAYSRSPFSSASNKVSTGPRTLMMTYLRTTQLTLTRLRE
jgi:hypothetical protein